MYEGLSYKAFSDSDIFVLLLQKLNDNFYFSGKYDLVKIHQKSLT